MIQENNVEKIRQEVHMAKLRGILKVCQLIEGTAVLLCPVDKGDLRNSIGYSCTLGRSGNISLPGGVDGIVGTNKEHAPHIEFGTRPHKITVKNASVLTDGKEFFGKEVNHPGTQAQPFMRPALDQNINNATEIMRNELAQVTK